MPVYNVHLYREMRVYIPGIEAETPEAAAQIARLEQRDRLQPAEDCDGADIAALVDVEGDEEYLNSKTIDFATVTPLPEPSK